MRAAAWYFLRARNGAGYAGRCGGAFPSRQWRAARAHQLAGRHSDKAMAQAHGLMVNYLYDLDDIEKNHEAYAEGPHRGRLDRRAAPAAAAARTGARSRGRPSFPYTGTTAPRVTRLSGDARNKIVAATSSTFGQASRFGFRHRLAVGRRVHDRRRDGVHQNAVLGDFLGQRHRERRDSGLGDCIGRHAGAGAPFQRLPRGHIDDAPAAWPPHASPSPPRGSTGNRRRDCCRAAPSARPCRSRRPCPRRSRRRCGSRPTA